MYKIKLCIRLLKAMYKIVINFMYKITTHYTEDCCKLYITLPLTTFKIIRLL